MADQGRQHHRFVLDGANVEVQAEGGLLGLGGKKPFVGQVFNLGQTGLQFLCREDSPVREKQKVSVVVHLKDHRAWLRTSGEVIWSRGVAGRPFKRVGVRFTDLDSAMSRQLRDIERDYLDKGDQESGGATGRLIEKFTFPEGETAPDAAERDVQAALSAEGRRFGKTSKGVQRPVALLELIAMLEPFEVTDDLVQAIIEAVQQNITVEELFGKESEEEIRPRRIVEEPERKREVRPVPIYRLSPDTRMHFNEEGMPVAPPVDHLFSSMFDGGNCFACELQDDSMSRDDGGLSFSAGDIVIFRVSDKAESGDLAFAQTRAGNSFTQVFFGADDLVRLRPLNGNTPESVYKRSEVKVCYKLAARLQRF